MARVTFTASQKAEAIMLLNKGLTGSEVCEKIGCSIASLQNWKKEYADGKFSLDDMSEDENKPTRGRPKKAKAETWEDDDEEQTSSPQPASYSPPKSTKPAISCEEFVKKYWQHKTVGSVMTMPGTIDEVVNLVNNALTFAYDQLSD